MAINYEKVGWDNSKFVGPTNMNQMDDGIKSACDGVDALNKSMGNDDISGVGDGSVKGAIKELNNNLNVEISNLITSIDTSMFSVDVQNSYRTGHIVCFATRVYIASQIEGWTDVLNLSIESSLNTICLARNEASGNIYSMVTSSMVLKSGEIMPGGWYQISGLYLEK